MGFLWRPGGQQTTAYWLTLGLELFMSVPFDRNLNHTVVLLLLWLFSLYRDSVEYLQKIPLALQSLACLLSAPADNICLPWEAKPTTMTSPHFFSMLVGALLSFFPSLLFLLTVHSQTSVCHFHCPIFSYVFSYCYSRLC